MQTAHPAPAAPLAEYARAAIPEPFQILGLRLRPFALGHYLLFQRFALQPHLRDDLILAVLICSMSAADFLRFLEQTNWHRQVQQWGRRIGLFDLEEKARLFQSYLDAGIKEPDYITLNAGDESGDWAQNLKMTLTMRLNYTEAQILAMPLAEALADYYRLAETDGIIRLLTAEDRAMAEANAAALAQHAAQPTREATCPA